MMGSSLCKEVTASLVNIRRIANLYYWHSQHTALVKSVILRQSLLDKIPKIFCMFWKFG